MIVSFLVDPKNTVVLGNSDTSRAKIRLICLEYTAFSLGIYFVLFIILTICFDSVTLILNLFLL